MSEIQSRLAAMEPGTVAHGALSLGHMASGQELTIPYSLFRGRAPDPCLWVNAMVHGNEAPAAITAVRFGQSLDPGDLQGSVVVTPIANPTAVDARLKHSPFDGVDLDQSYPGRGLLMTERIAQRLFDACAPVATLAVNIHTMSPFMDASRYCVYKSPPDDRVSEEQLLSYAACFSPFVTCRMDLGGHGELPGNIGGALDYQLLRIGIPALMVELGGAGQWNESMIEMSVRGFHDLARLAGVIAGEAAGVTEVTRVHRRTHLACESGGFFRADVTPGTILPAGVPIGHVLDVRGGRTPVTALDHDALVIGVRRDPLVHPGDRVGFVGLSWDEVSIG